MRVIHAKIKWFGDHSLKGWWVSQGFPFLEGRLVIETEEAPTSCIINDINWLAQMKRTHPHLVSPKLVVQVLPYKERPDLFPVQWTVRGAAQVAA